MDNSTSGVGGFLETTAIGNGNRHYPVQRHPSVIGTPLPDPQVWASACHLPEELHVTVQLRALLPVPVAQPVDGVLSPASTGPRWLRPAGSAEFVGKSPRTT